MLLPGNTFKSCLLGFLVFLGLLLPGCHPGYLFHAGTGQFKILYRSVEIEKALDSEILSAEQKERLLLVQRVKTFGETELGLKKTENYRKVYLESRQPPVFLVCACPKDRFEKKTWWFPLVGSMPYIGFFDLKKARAEEGKLLKQDMDVYIGLADAYSTLGWFKDPVTLNLLQGSTNALVETIFHETTHITLYLKGQSEFNEGVAVMVGMYGALAFFRQYYGDSHPFSLQAKKAIHDEILFSHFIDRLLNRLETLYSSSLQEEEKLRQREVIFHETMNSFHLTEDRFRTNRFKNFKRNKINNAFLITIGLYHGHFNLFRQILACRQNSIKDTVAWLKTMTERETDPILKMSKWLEKQRS